MTGESKHPQLGALAHEAALKNEAVIHEQFDALSHDNVLYGVSLGRLLGTKARPLYDAMLELDISGVRPDPSRTSRVNPVTFLQRSNIRFTRSNALELNWHRYMRTKDLLDISRDL